MATRCVINLSTCQWPEAIAFIEIFYAHHWEETPEPKRTQQWLWYFQCCGYHWKWYSKLLLLNLLISSNYSPEDIDLNKLPVGNGIKEFWLLNWSTFIKPLISPQGIQSKNLECLYKKLWGYIISWFNKYLWNLQNFLSSKLISPTVSVSQCPSLTSWKYFSLIVILFIVN